MEWNLEALYRVAKAQEPPNLDIVDYAGKMELIWDAVDQLAFVNDSHKRCLQGYLEADVKELVEKERKRMKRKRQEKLENSQKKNKNSDE